MSGDFLRFFKESKQYKISEILVTMKILFVIDYSYVYRIHFIYRIITSIIIMSIIVSVIIAKSTCLVNQLHKSITFLMALRETLVLSS